MLANFYKRKDLQEERFELASCIEHSRWLARGP